MEALVLYAVLFLVLYFALVLPQQRRAKKTRELLSSLAEGDEVVTSSGIHGFITTLDEQIVWLEIAEGVELKMSRSAVAGKINDIDEETAEAGLGDTDEID